jgi:hypothetical protein
MGKRALILYSGPVPKRRQLLALESSRYYKSPDATIHALCAVIEDLPPAARRLWTAAVKRFDVGYEMRPTKRSSHFTLRSDTLERIARLGSTLAVTYYRGEAKF